MSVKIHLVFKGETMQEARAEMEGWAQEFCCGIVTVAVADPTPPRKRSFKGQSVEAPLPVEAPVTHFVTGLQVVEPVEQLDLLAPKPPKSAPAESEGNIDAVVEAATRYAEAHGKPALRKLLKAHGCDKVREMDPAQHVAFITAAARGPA